MTLLRTITRVSDKFRIVCNKNYWNSELCFGTKVEIPSPPKRPLTAYMIYCKENRSNILKDNPSLSSPEQIKILAEKWGNLTTDMKKPYEVSARESTLVYGELHKKFYENLTENQKEELAKLKTEKRESRRMLKLKKALRDSGLPKPGISAYSLYVQSEARKKQSFKHVSEFIKSVAESWKSLPEDSKKKFEEQSQAQKKRYVSELNAWRSKMLSEGNDHLIEAFQDIKRRGKFLVSEDVQPTKKKSADKKLPKLIPLKN